MDEAERTATFTEALRLYAEQLRQGNHLGPFKALLSGDSVQVTVQFNGNTVRVTPIPVTESPPEVEAPIIEPPTIAEVTEEPTPKRKRKT